VLVVPGFRTPGTGTVSCLGRGTRRRVESGQADDEFGEFAEFGAAGERSFEAFDHALAKSQADADSCPNAIKIKFCLEDL